MSFLFSQNSEVVSTNFYSDGTSKVFTISVVTTGSSELDNLFNIKDFSEHTYETHGTVFKLSKDHFKMYENSQEIVWCSRYLGAKHSYSDDYNCFDNVIEVRDILNIISVSYRNVMLKRNLLKNNNIKVGYLYPYLNLRVSGRLYRFRDSKFMENGQLSKLGTEITNRINNTFIYINNKAIDMSDIGKVHEKMNSLRIASPDFDFSSNDVDYELLESLLPLVWRYILSGLSLNTFFNNTER